MIDVVEAAEAAHIAARLAWLYPDDPDMQEAVSDAVLGLSGHRISYVDLVVRKIDMGCGLDIEQARRAVAEDFRLIADRLYAGEAC